MRSRLAAAWAIAASVLGAGCQPPRCPPLEVRLPATESVAPWLEPSRPKVAATMGGGDAVALLDTGYPRSASFINPRIVNGNSEGFAGAVAGPMIFDPFFAPPPGLDLIIGADMLSRVPLVMDARAHQTRVEPGFTPGPGAAPLSRWSSGLCRGDDPRSGAEGPDLLLVEADLDGQALTLAVDTGADVTIVRRAAIPDLDTRPTLSGLPLHTAFAGDVTVAATRARALAVGGQASAMTPVLVSPDLDRGLDLLLQQFRDPPPRLDGALGRTFLREFEVSLALGDDAETARALGLSRYDTQDHWSRDFVGVGIATSESATPAGLKIGALLSVSPARDAGLQVGDVILTVNGAPALTAAQPWAQPGEAVQLQVQRGAGTLTVPVPIADLLPDP